MSKPKIPENPFPWILLIALSTIAVHLAFYNTLGFHRDELLYFSQGRHLSFGYASVPPFTGFMAWLMIHLLGSTLFAARLLPALLSGFLVLLVDHIVMELKGKSVARILGAVGILVIPLILRCYYMFQPVFFDIFFWTLIFYLIVCWINRKKDSYLILTGIVVGIGIMNKYLVILQVVCLLVAFLFFPQRTVFRKKSFWIAAGLCFLLILPNLYWQFIHHFPVITHMHALHDRQLVHVDRVTFMTDQLFLGFMGMILILPGIFFLVSSKKMKHFRSLALVVFFVIAILLALRGKSYYTAGLYPFLIAIGAISLEFRIKTLRGLLITTLIMIIATLPFLPVSIPVMKEKKLAIYFDWMKRNAGLDMVLRWETGKIHTLPQDYADMLGWDELASIASKAYSQVPVKKECLIYCENYGQAGAIAVLGKSYDLPMPACFSESYYYWAPRELPYKTNFLIYINDELGEDVHHLFSDITKIGSITNPLAREYGTSVWLCRKPVTSFNEFWKERVLQIKSPFF